MARVSAIIISFNTCALTLECLTGLHRELDALDSEVWLVDNASTDGTVDAIREGFPDVRIIENQENRGFGAANNQALQQATGDFLLLLNSDAFPRPGAVKAMVHYLRDHPEVGVVGPRLLNADGSLQRSCYRFPSPRRTWLEMLGIVSLFPNHPVVGDYRRWDHAEDRLVDFVSGACMMVRREAFEAVGGFDEQFFMYAEETDWQLRMKRQGWDVAFTSGAEVVHLGGSSGASTMAGINPTFFESGDYYQLKHYGQAGLVIMRLAMVIGCAIRAAGWGLIMLVLPSRRRVASQKARLFGWLFIRQTINWSILKTGVKG